MSLQFYHSEYRGVKENAILWQIQRKVSFNIHNINLFYIRSSAELTDQIAVYETTPMFMENVKALIKTLTRFLHENVLQNAKICNEMLSKQKVKQK